MYKKETKAIPSIENPKSINNPNNAVPNAVENTINAVVRALIDPIYFTPYISAHVDEPKTLAKPLEIPISPKKMKADNETSKNIRTKVDNNNGIFINIRIFLLVNLSIKNPATSRVITEKIE